jgi:hypothetical protein
MYVQYFTKYETKYVPVKSFRIRERRLEIAQTISLNCSMTHSPGKIEYNCGYFIMTFRTQIHKKKFDKNCFCTLQVTMSHRPLAH